MASLNSPGVQVTIIDESNYTPAPTGTVPFLVVATAQNKTTPSGDVAEYTTAANAGKVFLVTSQRELINKYGKPTFLVANGTPVHGYELNEYGLMAAYSALGVSNAAYIMRADVNLSELQSSLTRPNGSAANNTLWLDTEETRFGIFEWTPGLSNPWVPVLPTNNTGDSKLHVITDTDLISSNEPLTSIGKPGDYAIDATDINNPVFFKAETPSLLAGTWVQVGSSDWQLSWPAVVSTVANPNIANISGNVFSINGTNVTVGANIAATLGNINVVDSANIYAALTNEGRIAVYCNSNVGNVSFENESGTPLTVLGFTPTTEYQAPAFVAAKHTQVPQWGANDTNPRPAGSVWFKITAPNLGADFVVKRYNAASDTWVELTTPVYSSDTVAINELDSVGGGLNIPARQTYIQSDVTDSDEFTFKLFERTAGVTRVSGSTANPVFTSGNIVIASSIPGNASLQPGVTIAVSGGNADALIGAINNAAIPYVSAAQETTGRITITHSTGGVMEMYTVNGNILTTAGITTGSTGARESDVNPGRIWVSNWQEAEYTVSGNTPVADPANGTYWYYNSPTEFDIMINDGTDWKGYQMVSADSRGYDLSATSPAGPLVSASEPLFQSDGTTLVDGDLWINTANLEDFPKIYRYQNNAWVLIDVTDQTSENGIVFADARWGTSANIDVVTDDIPSIESLLSSDYTDPDCPSYALYPRGTLLFNTRRSGLNVKQFVVDHFADADPAPAYTNAWVSASGNDANGVAYLGRKAQRALVVAKMAAAVSNSVEAIEETRNFNIIAAPGYPEMSSTLVQLNVNRKETAFVLADTPFRLTPNSNELAEYSSGVGNEDNLVNYEYMAGYYPSGYTRDLDGNNAVVPPTHMALRTIIRSDQKSYPWFAPAGIRRGTVDNATAIGYIDGQSGEFRSIGLGNNLRDVLYLGKINPITVLPGSGITVYGQKTRSATTSALDRVNVARLVVYLRRQLDLIARQYIFEPNDEITRKEIKNQIEKELNSIQSNRGINDYLVVCDTSNNTPDRIDRNELWVDVAIEPIKAVEFIYIPVRIKNTGDIEAGL